MADSGKGKKQVNIVTGNYELENGRWAALKLSDRDR
jgi:hypothetical protein